MRRKNTTMGPYARNWLVYTISVLNDRDLVPLIKQLAEGMTGYLKFQIDAWFSTVSHKMDVETGEITRKYGLFYPNTWGCVNSTKYLNTPEDLENLLDEIEPLRFREQLVENSLQRHTPFIESGVNFHRVLCYQIIVDVLPPHFLFPRK